MEFDWESEEERKGSGITSRCGNGCILKIIEE